MSIILKTKIGNFVSKEKGLIIKEKNGDLSTLKYSEVDEITKIFKDIE